MKSGEEQLTQLNLRITKKMKNKIQEAVKQGFYTSPSELVRDAIREKLLRE